MENSTDLHPFETLGLSFILDAVDSVGFETDGRVTILNSYKNRVYQIGIEESEPIIAKFYRPGRWTNQQIQEEHDYCYELVDAELPVVAPIKNNQDNSHI